MQLLKPGGSAERCKFCEWILKDIHNRELDIVLIIFTGKDWFHLHGYVNSRNSDIFHEVSLYNVKICEWYVINETKMIGPWRLLMLLGK